LPIQLGGCAGTGLFAAVRQNTNLRLIGYKQNLRSIGFTRISTTVRQALRDMIRWIRELLRGLSKADAYTLCSLAADFRMTQMVNMAKGAHCMLPKSILG
jgi:acetamidase/formamidase